LHTPQQAMVQIIEAEVQHRPHRGGVERFDRGPARERREAELGVNP
jgi:hypothetical protein